MAETETEEKETEKVTMEQVSPVALVDYFINYVALFALEASVWAAVFVVAYKFVKRGA